MLKLLLLFFTISLFAREHIDLTPKQISIIAQHQKWKQLLYMNNETSKSEVIDTTYFLSKDGNHSARAELQATINAYNESFDTYEDPNQHPICRFPARYFWLNSQISLPDYQVVDPRCSHLEKSLQETKVNSVSLMFVTGYLGNPASSFGHSFIKLNTTQNNLDLFDLSISYGADVPKGENVFFYIYRGLFGKYSARFRDKYFYANDLVYTATEQRDIWEYKLDLTQQQILFLRLHLWELLHKKFQYFFLNQNCGYEVTKTLSVVLKEPLKISNKVWYAPIETLYSLEERKKVNKILFHPSTQKKLYENYQQLSNKQQKAVQTIVKNNFNLQSLQYFSQADTIKILNFLISYYDFMILQDVDAQKYEHLKYKALLKRITLPKQGIIAANWKISKPPHTNDKPSFFEFGYTYNKNEANSVKIAYSPYAIQTIGWNNLGGDSLSILQTEFAVKKNSFKIAKFDLIDIKKFNKNEISNLTDNTYTWRVHAGYQSELRYQNDYFVDLAVGKSFFQSDNFLFFTMLNASLHTYKQHYLVAPEIGIRYANKYARVYLQYDRQFDLQQPNQNFNQLQINTAFEIQSNLLYKIHYTYNEGYLITNALQINF
ncbi:putative outermembrane protein [hydrothermal vent metagenome]|uniref:Putative outermembrane protein n=1 Tax=hydrothermal vent metagenome TaxID=652676 RepID=A0A1W1C3J4_9ZZZZ